MPIIAKKSVEIPTGRYSGRVESVEVVSAENAKGETVQYLNIHVQTGVKSVDGWNGHFKLSCPFYLTNQSALGRLLRRLGMAVAADEEFDEQDLVGLNLAFDTVREGYFTNPVLDSVSIVKSA